jgi:hypothetical protein
MSRPSHSSSFRNPNVILRRVITRTKVFAR